MCRRTDTGIFYHVSSRLFTGEHACTKLLNIYTDAQFTYSKRTSVFVENERIQTQRSYFVSDDYTRVILSNKEGVDYINANFVKVTPEQLKS